VISWPTSVVSYILQSAPDMQVWSTTGEKAFLTGTRMSLTNNTPGSARFFRLKTP